jgi:hypothetical protein
MYRSAGNHFASCTGKHRDDTTLLLNWRKRSYIRGATKAVLTHTIATRRFITRDVVPNREGRPHARQCAEVFHQQEVSISPHLQDATGRWKSYEQRANRTALFPRIHIVIYSRNRRNEWLANYENSPDVEFCGYTIPHPSETKMHVRIQTWGQ